MLGTLALGVDYVKSPSERLKGKRANPQHTRGERFTKNAKIMVVNHIRDNVACTALPIEENLELSISTPRAGPSNQVTRLRLVGCMPWLAMEPLAHGTGMRVLPEIVYGSYIQRLAIGWYFGLGLGLGSGRIRAC